MKIKILSYVYDLIQEKGFRHNNCRDNQHRDEGQIDFTHFYIKVDPDHPEKDCTVLHEIIHAVSRYWDIGLGEKETETLAQGLYHVLKENGIDFSKDEVFPPDPDVKDDVFRVYGQP